jgi:hypothetical protein
MNIQAYLESNWLQGKTRGKLSGSPKSSRYNTFSVYPSRTLDIHYGKQITLRSKYIYKKVVEKKRGGFCYELNLLFHGLLRELGFESRIIAARIFDSQGVIGPAFDHMCLLVELEQLWLVDVGLAICFSNPLPCKRVPYKPMGVITLRWRKWMLTSTYCSCLPRKLIFAASTLLVRKPKLSQTLPSSLPG